MKRTLAPVITPFVVVLTVLSFVATISANRPQVKPLIRLEPTMPTGGDQQILCPDGALCPNSSTCCLIYTGKYMCCGTAAGNCCSDYYHCCDSGYVCNMAAYMCVTPPDMKDVLDKMKRD